MEKKIKVAIADFPPLIMDEGGHYKGFEIDLWEIVAKDAGIDFEYEKHELKEIIPLLTEKKIDVGLAGITTTERREGLVDFSHPTMNSGLLICTDKHRNRPDFLKTLKIILTEGARTVKPLLLVLFFFISIFANLLWLAEKNIGTFGSDYFPGILRSVWFIIVTMGTVGYGDYVPVTWAGKAVSTLVIFGGFAIFVVLISQITAFLTIRKIRRQIACTGDLAGKRVATIEGSTSVDFLKRIRAKIVTVSKIEEAYQKLQNNGIDAVVFDAPAVMHFEQKDDKKSFEIVGELMEKQLYAIALQQPSPLEEKINRSLLKIKESGQYDAIYKIWFGEDFMMAA